MQLIGTHSMDFQCSSIDFGKELLQHLGYLLEKEFYPKLELLLEKYEYKNYTWNIDLLELNLPNISKKNWKNELINQSLKQIEDYFKKNRPFIQINISESNFNSGNLVTGVQHASFLFFKFLKTGVLAENSISNQLEKIVNKIEITDNFLKELIRLFEDNPTFLIRWIFAVPDLFREKVINTITDFQYQLKPLFKKYISVNEPVTPRIKHLSQKFISDRVLSLQWIELIQWIYFLHQKTTTKQTLLESLVSLSAKHWNISSQELKCYADVMQSLEKNENVKFSTALQDFFQELENKILSETKDTYLKKDESTDNLVEKVYFISNAGLVIFHPFLKQLFEQLGLCENGNWKDNISQYKAILLTQYLITGQVTIYENELILNKILCGLPIECEVNTKSKISRREKAKCHSLLQAILEHWSVMKDSSVEALRETFLQRNGKLVFQESQIELLVEQKGVDILLSQLPWGIGMIRTPWMEEYLTVNWEY